MRLPDHVEVMCPRCRVPIRVPITVSTRFEHADDVYPVIVESTPDESALHDHICRPSGCHPRRRSS